MYATYGYYNGTYKGNLVPEAQFPRVVLRASRAMDARTFGRIDADPAATDDVQMACCAVCDIIYADEQAEAPAGAIISSEKVGGHSVTYAVDATMTTARRIDDVLADYLGHTGLMSAAVPYRTGCAR